MWATNSAAHVSTVLKVARDAVALRGARGSRSSVRAGQRGDAPVGEAELLGPAQHGGRRSSASRGSRPRRRRSRGCSRGTTGRSASARGSRRSSARPGRRRRWRTAGRGSGTRSSARSSSASAGRSSVRPQRSCSSERTAFWSASLNVRPIAMTSPTDFICVVSVRSASGNFSKAQRGIFTTQ